MEAKAGYLSEFQASHDDIMRLSQTRKKKKRLYYMSGFMPIVHSGKRIISRGTGKCRQGNITGSREVRGPSLHSSREAGLVHESPPATSSCLPSPRQVETLLPTLPLLEFFFSKMH